MKSYIVMGAAAAAFAAASVFAGPAFAKGCGGYVNVAVWGCAPWDNNPPKAGVTPGYKAPAPKPQPVAQPRQPTPPSNLSGGGRLVTDNGAGIVSRDGAGVKAGNNSGLVGNAGGALVGNAGGALVGNAGGTLVGNAGGTALPRR